MSEVTQDLEALKAEADQLGIKYHPSIGFDALQGKVDAFKEAAAHAKTEDAQKDPDPQGPLVPPVAPVAEPEPETPGQRRKRLKLEATRLVRIRITCMNPAKKELDGEIITVANRLVGELKRYIPYNAEDGWHVPYMMYLHLQERQCQVFTTKRNHRGVEQREGRLIKEFAIEMLPDLTKEELAELAARQAATRAID